MPARSGRLVISAALASFVAVACAATPAPSTPSAAPPSVPAASGTPTPAASPSAAPAELLLKVTSEGGFINPVASLNALPLVEVYADGRILTPAAQDAIAPAPLVAAVEVRDVGAAGAA